MRAAFFLFILLFSHCASAQREKVPYVVLISFDGFRYDYTDRYSAPNFEKLQVNGAKAKALIPSFPSKTFPNHYSIVTGLYPGHHGLVDNSFYDPVRDQYYSMSKKERVTDPYFYGGVPLWQLASQNHIGSASFFWVGSELPDNHPDYYYAYNKSFPDTSRVDRVLEWLKLPEKDRPHFISLYFSSPDEEGHEYGPLSEENKNAVMNADKLLGRLMAGLDLLKLPVNIVVVSDHGMKELKEVESTYLFLDELLDVNSPSIRFSNGGTQAHIYMSDSTAVDSLYSVLRDKAHHFSVWKRSEFPAHWHYQNKRSGDLMIIADEGYYIRDGKRSTFIKTLSLGSSFGVHGYDPENVKDMRGIFYAMGPNIQRGVILEPFENIHIYPLIARILRLPLPEIDGRFEVVKKIYKRTP